MNEYILGVIGTVLLSALILSVLPEGKTATLIKSITKLLCVLSVTAPVFQFVSGKNVEKIFDETSIKEDASYIEYCSKKSVEETQKQLEIFIEEEYSLSASVRLQWEYSNVTTDGLGVFAPIAYGGRAVKIVKICVTVVEALEKDTANGIKSDLEQKFLCEVEVA